MNQLRELKSCGDPAGCGALYVSVGRWLRPSGEEIEGLGIRPDIVVAMTGDNYIKSGDLQVFAAIDVLRGDELPPPPASDNLEEEAVEVEGGSSEE